LTPEQKPINRGKAMAKTKIPTLIIVLMAAFIFGCSQPDPQWTINTSQNSNRDTLVNEDSTSAIALAESDTTKSSSPDIDEALDKAESFYAVGVHFFQISQLDSAQAAYEQSLAILSGLDLDPEQNPDQAARMERLLNEIEEDYRLTLISSGTLSSDASITAFRELFSDLKNFKKLKESGLVADFNEADTTNYDIEIEWNDKVENSLIYLQTVARNKFTTYLERSATYLPIMEKIFKDKGLPHDLVYLPLIESGFNASAYSYAKASGFWQFISSTGKIYGLDHNWWFDERRDFVKATEAAASHLKDLYNTFGSWNLALAAYNAGAGRVGREIKRSKTNNFWKLDLAQQTKTYVPLYMAATIIAKQPNKYGFFPEYQQPLDFETIPINKCLSFNSISSKTGIPVSDLEKLNPELLRGVTPPDISNYPLRIPRGYQETFTSIYNDITAEQAISWAKHKVKKGETVSSIAKKYGISSSTILAANDLSKGKKLRVGQILTIPLQYSSSSKSVDVASATTKAAPSTPTPVKSQPIKIDSPTRYMVKNGDTLWEIAAAYGVSISELKRLNELGTNTVYAGRWLKIPEHGSDVQVQTAQVTYDIYTVKRGDNLSKIANRYKVTPESIRDANQLPTNRLYAGMSLKIPSKASSNTQVASRNQNVDKEIDNKVYTVKRGDTLWKIAKNHGVEISDLAKWNNISPRSRLSPGDKLKIYL
jgi:membrane-bound lytic murein transglycosylase D